MLSRHWPEDPFDMEHFTSLPRRETGVTWFELMILLWVVLAFWIVINGILFDEYMPTLILVEYMLRTYIGIGLIEPTLNFAAELFRPVPKINPRAFLQYGKKEQKKKEPWFRR